MEDTFAQVGQILSHIVANLTNPDAWQEILRKPGVMTAAFIAVTLIVFTETGLLVGFFLPGDSLLVTVGLVAGAADPRWPIEYLIPMLWVAAIAGDSSGYFIGKKAGPRLFRREKSFFFRKDYLLMAQEFYERHGGKTIILAKFMPIVRTFAPVVAGAGQMPYRRFLAYSVCGAVTWITSMILLGYTLPMWLDPILRQIFGRDVAVAKHIDKLILVVVVVSVLPLVIKGGKGWLAKRNAAKAGLPKETTPTV